MKKIVSKTPMWVKYMTDDEDEDDVEEEDDDIIAVLG